jgi:hypothetical protein
MSTVRRINLDLLKEKVCVKCFQITKSNKLILKWIKKNEKKAIQFSL